MFRLCVVVTLVTLFLLALRSCMIRFFLCKVCCVFYVESSLVRVVCVYVGGWVRPVFVLAAFLFPRFSTLFGLLPSLFLWKSGRNSAWRLLKLILFFKMRLQLLLYPPTTGCDHVVLEEDGNHFPARHRRIDSKTRPNIAS